MKKILIRVIKKSPLILSLAKSIIAKYRQLESKFKWNALKKSMEIKLELGSGGRVGINGWTTVDNENSEIGSDISWDLRKGIPLPDNSVHKIYSSHLLEHIPYNQLLIFLRECRRVMKTDGKFLVCVPNFRLYVDAYAKGENFKDRETWWKPGSVDTGSAMDQLNYAAYMQDQHKYVFDEENLINTLLKAGFSDAQLREFDPTLDLKERDSESIYAVALK